MQGVSNKIVPPAILYVVLLLYLEILLLRLGMLLLTLIVTSINCVCK